MSRQWRGKEKRKISYQDIIPFKNKPRNILELNGRIKASFIPTTAENGGIKAKNIKERIKKSLYSSES